MNHKITTPLTFRSGHQMRNRFALAPLTNHQCEDDGTVTDAEMKFLKMRAEGGFGLVMTCAAQIEPSGRGQGFPGQLGVQHDRLLPGMKRIAEALKDTFSVVQIHHAGIRSPKEIIGQQPVGPSDHEKTGSRAMTNTEVKQVIKDFIAAAVRCEKAGFDGVEIHGAHGYLLTQFLSTKHNLRTDEYGGSYENRTRIVWEIIAGIKQVCSAGFSFGIRLSPEGNGMPLREVTKFCQELIDEGSLDYLDISLWDCFKEPEEVEFQGRSLLSYFTDLNWGNVKLVVAGKLNTPQDVEAIIDQGADFVMLGRAGILNHDFPNRYLANPRFTAHQLPVTITHLEQEGVSPAFIKYLSGWDGFVKA
jgi:2,4-dienoyl-CoA reductase-like NADH-dependent reductase (Old Yellow Enzyme family)